MKKYVAPAITVEKLALNNVIATSLKVHNEAAQGGVQAEERKENPIWD